MPFETFSKLKTKFSKYWVSIKLKINMEWIYKEYEVKNKNITGIMDTSKYEGFFVLKTLVGVE